MGLFDAFRKKGSLDNAAEKPFRNEIERNMYVNNTLGYKDTKDRLDYQNNLLSRVNAAQEKYKEDKNIEAVIRELEYAFIESDPPCASSQNMDLIDYYVKAGKNDKAWAYLNRLYTYGEAPVEKVRFAQARILKKEKKWHDALEMYMLGYLKKSEWNNNFQEDMFKKDIKSLVNKLNWDSEKVDYLCYLIGNHVKNRDYSESSLSQEYRQFLSDIS